MNAESESNNPADAAVLQGAQPTHCVPMRRKNDFYSATLRMDYDIGHDMTLTSLTDYMRFNRFSGVDGAGVAEQDYQSLQVGKITTVFQEVRLSGKWWNGKGNWIVGANFEYDSTWDRFLQTYNGSTASPTQIPFSSLCGAFGGCNTFEDPTSPTWDSTKYPLALDDTLGPTAPSDFQKTNTYAVYASGEYPLLDNLSLLGGIRFTQENKTGGTCGTDGGDGSWSTVASHISNLLELLDTTTADGSPEGYLFNTYAAATPGSPINGHTSLMDAYLNGAGQGINAGPHGCGTTGFAPDYLSYGNVFPGGDLNENNISWKAGLNWKVMPQTLLYVTFSQGFKGGSFPTVAMSSAAQANPVHQENLIAYEGGFKSTLFDRQLTLNGAVFYYDYTDKQILGARDRPDLRATRWRAAGERAQVTRDRLRDVGRRDPAVPRRPDHHSGGQLPA